MGLKGLYGPGVGRYGAPRSPTLPAATSGEFSPLHNLSALGTVEIAATPRLTIYLNYGGDYAGRSSWSGTTLGAPSVAQNAAGVYGWSLVFAIHRASRLRLLLPQQLLLPHHCRSRLQREFHRLLSRRKLRRPDQRRPGSSPPGYWYDFYKGDYGRVRLGMQYAYSVRHSWTGAVVSANGPDGVGAKGIDNMFWTCFRYYLP